MEASACPGCQALQRRIAELEAQVERLIRLLDEQRRAGKRQAAPFSKGEPKKEPKKPGRKPGADYGSKAHRPPPEQIDEVHESLLPDQCPDCGGPVDETHVDQQYQVEIPRRPIHRQFNIHIGCCRHCQRRVQGRHPLQTSDALGAAASQLGGDAQAAVVDLNKQAGLSHGKVTRVLESLFGIDLSRGGSAHTVLRAAQRCQPIYAELCASFADSDWAVLDETGWRLGGRLAWLHTLVGPQATVYVVDPTRSGVVAERILGRDYDGIMIHDGWSPYDDFACARHQQCLAHLLRRAHELLETATRGAVRFPRAVADLLQAALGLRDRHASGEVSSHGLAVARGRLAGKLYDLLWPVKTNPANERFAKHLWNHRDQLFTFLEVPGLDATNWRGEQAIRGGVILRKVWGGNRTERGGNAQSVLMSIWRTCWQRGVSALDWLSQRLRCPTIPLPQPP
jgi:transposase